MNNIVVNKTTLEVFVTKNLEGYNVSEWLHNPDSNVIKAVPSKYWKVDGDTIIEMTQEEKDTKDEQILQESKDAKISDLWNACYDYQNQFFNEPMWTKIMQMQLMGDTRANDIDTWINGLWNEYYSRRYIANHAVDLTTLNSVSTDFSDYGEPPYRVYELLGVTL